MFNVFSCCVPPFFFFSVSSFSKIVIWKLQKYSLRNLRKFDNLGYFDLLRKNCWNSGKCSSKLVNVGKQLQKVSEILKIRLQKCENVGRNLAFFSSERCRSVFHGFSIGFQRCNKCVNLLDLVKSFHTSIYYLVAKIGFDTAENEPLGVCRKLANS